MQQAPQAPPLPPVPQSEEPQPKKRLPRWAIIVGAIFGGLVLVTAIAPKDSPAAAIPAASVASCVDVDGAIALNTDAASELQAGVGSLESYDIDGGATHLESAAADYAEIARIFSDYPTISGPASSASTNMMRSATELRSMNIDVATTYLKSATSDIDETRDGTDALVGEVTPC